MKLPKEPEVQVDLIRLPDGREFRLRDIMVKATNRVNYNLRTGLVKKVGRSQGRRMPAKYTIEERVWHTQADVNAIAQRYNISLTTAQGLKYTSKSVINRLEITAEDIARMDLTEFKS